MIPDIFATSDTHYGHDKISFYSSRPFSSVEEMNETLIVNHNAIVKPDDIIYNLGDFAFMKLQAFKGLLRRLNGHKRVILGNHDKVIRKNREELLKEGLLESIQDYEELKIDGQLIVMAHYSHRVWNKSHRGSVHIFGHSHNSLPPLGKSVDVGVDAKYVLPGTDVRTMGKLPQDYRPLHLDEILSWAAKQEFVQIDAHAPRKPKEEDQ